MPELPEVETMRRGIRGVVGCRVEGVLRPRCRLRPIAVEPSWVVLRRRLTGREILAVERVGKRVVLRLDDQSRVVFEPRMTGLVLLTDPPDQEHLRLGLALAYPGGAAAPGGRHEAPPVLWYWDRRGLGQVRWLSDKAFVERYLSGHLGPDALLVSADELRARLGGSRRAIKVGLLDQAAVAGVGNLYASEILHVARIHPARPARSLAAAEWQVLHAALTDVLNEAVRYEGSTLSDGTYRNALNQAGSYQNHHRVYDRAGQPCVDCQGAEIVRVVQAQRATFFCPICQPRRRGRPR